MEYFLETVHERLLHDANIIQDGPVRQNADNG